MQNIIIYGSRSCGSPNDRNSQNGFTNDVLLDGLTANAWSGDQHHTFGKYMSYDSYGLMSAGS